MEGRPSRLVPCDFRKREPCVRHARDDIVFRLSVAPSIYHYRHNQRLLLLKYWPGHDVYNRTLEINLKGTPVTIETVQEIFYFHPVSPLQSNITSHVKFISTILYIFFPVLDIVNLWKSVPANASIRSNMMFTSWGCYWHMQTACVTYCLSFVLMKELKSNLSTEHISAINECGVTDLLDTFMGVGG